MGTTRSPCHPDRHGRSGQSVGVGNRRRQGIGAGQAAVPLADIVVAAFLTATDDDLVNRHDESSFLDDHLTADWARRR